MSERLTLLNSQDVKATMRRIEPQESFSESISKQLQETVYGQEEAMDAIARRLALFGTGLSDPKRPLGAMFFLGPSGVGKTEASHAAAKYMFGDTHSGRLKIINMAEMTEQHDTKKFVGSPPSYVGYGEKPLIAHDWLHAGRSIIVLDEFEKAHPAVQQLFLGALDKGSMDARNGNAGIQPLDFKNTLFIFTANIGGKQMHEISEGQSGIGFKTTELTEEQKQQRIKGIADKGLKEHLSPEFLNRIDDIIVFSEIRDRAIHAKIFDKFLAYRNADLVEGFGKDAPYFAVTEEFKNALLDSVGNKGGREMKRELERKLFDKAADVFMGMDVLRRPLVADIEDGETVFYTSDPEPISDMDTPIDLDEYRDRKNLPAPYDDPSESWEKKDDGGEDQSPPLDRPDSHGSPSSGSGEKPPVRLGLHIRIWDESMIDENGEVEYSAIDIRRLPLPNL